jgi:hopanoid biosynthesis associated protein HpnK
MLSQPSLLVVNADDFGISRGVNRGIVEAHRAGLVTSASLMANLPAAEDAVTRAAVCPDLGLGLHLTLTAGRPLSPPNRVSTLTDADGQFLVLGTLLARLTAGQVRADEIKRELSAQLAWALHRGIQPGHLDSHHHLHIHPRVAPIVVRLAREHGIPWVRSGAEGTPAPRLVTLRPRDAARTLVISAMGAMLRWQLRRAGLRTADHFRGIALGTGFGRRDLLAVLRALPPGLTELMTHPGYADGELARHTVFAKGRDRELDALTSGAARTLVAQRRIALTRFPEAARLRTYT